MVKQYASDTANSVAEHILTIALNLTRMIDEEGQEIERLNQDVKFIAHVC